MSLYNALFGVNPASPVLLAMLGISEHDVPRFCDCYLDGGRIAIYTRTGGGNRDSYENPERRRESYPTLYTTEEQVNAGPFNEDLRKIPGYLHDEDDDFDCTYATFYFDVPEKFKQLLDKIPEGEDPAKRWKDTLAALETATPDDPRVKKVMEVMAPVMQQITDKLDKGESGVVTI